MGMRPFAGIQAQAGTAQPVFGTAVTAAFTPPPDRFSTTGNPNGPGTNETQVSVTVTSTLGFLTGDKVAIGLAALFKPGLAASGLDYGTVKQIIDSTHLLVQGLRRSHAASGEWCVLSEEAGTVHIRPVVGAAAQIIGNASTVAANDPSVLDVLPIVAAGAGPTYVFDAESIGATQPFTLTEFWTVGTAADTFCARFTEV